jgi:hypothetical protein
LKSSKREGMNYDLPVPGYIMTNVGKIWKLDQNLRSSIIIRKILFFISLYKLNPVHEPDIKTSMIDIIE